MFVKNKSLKKQTRGIKKTYKKHPKLFVGLGLIALAAIIGYFILNKPIEQKSTTTDSQKEITGRLAIETQPAGVQITADCLGTSQQEENTCTSTSAEEVSLTAPADYTDAAGKKYTFSSWQGCDKAEDKVCRVSYKLGEKLSVTAIYSETAAAKAAPKPKTIPIPNSCAKVEKLPQPVHLCTLSIDEIPKVVEVSAIVRGKAPSYTVQHLSSTDIECVREDRQGGPACTFEGEGTSSGTTHVPFKVTVHNKVVMKIKAPDYVAAQECGVRIYSPCFPYEQYRLSGFTGKANKGSNYQITVLYDFQCYQRQPAGDLGQYPYEKYRCEQ